MRLFVLLSLALVAACSHGAPTPDASTSGGTVAQPDDDARRLALSDDGFCQVMQDGRIRCRLLNFWPASRAEQPPEGRFRQIVAHVNGFCALREDGAVVCWQKTDTTWNSRLKFDGEYTELASSLETVCALRTDGAMECAGPVFHTPRKEPAIVTAVEMPEGRYTRIFSGHSICAITRAGGSHCYQSAHRDVPEDRPGGVVNMRYHERHSDSDPFVKAVQTRRWNCGLSASGRVFCMASFLRQHLALAGHDVSQTITTFREGLYTDLVAYRDVCARRVSGEWICEDGVETTPGVEVPAFDWHHDHYRFQGLGEDGRLIVHDAQPEGRFVDVYGRDSVCAIRDDESVYCTADYRPWDDHALEGIDALTASEYRLMTSRGQVGLNRDRDKGDGKVHGRNDPRNADHDGYVEVQHGNDFGCGLRENGEVVCWGSIMGSKRRINPPGDRMKAIALGGVAACGITADEGKVRCWGSNYFGHVDNAPSKGGFVELRTTYLNVCGERDDGSVHCWGRSHVDRPTFEMPFVPRSWALTEAGVCGLGDDSVQCWGMGVVWN